MEATIRRAEHGTYAAYQRHNEQGTDPCTECRLAMNAYHRSLRLRNRLNEGWVEYAAMNLPNGDRLVVLLDEDTLEWKAVQA